MWQKFKDFCQHWITITVSTVVGFLSLVLELILDAPDLINADQLKSELSNALSNHPTLVARLSLLLSIIFILARLKRFRDLGQKKDEP